MLVHNFKVNSGYGQALAAQHATNVLKEKRIGRHATILSMEEFTKLAEDYSVDYTIVSTHEYGEYSSIVYEIK